MALATSKPILGSAQCLPIATLPIEDFGVENILVIHEIKPDDDRGRAAGSIGKTSGFKYWRETASKG